MEKYYVINEKEEIEYHLYSEDTIKGKKFSLFYSDSHKIWSEHTCGKLIMTAEDDGNDIKFTPNLKKTMDYAELFELNILISFARVDQMKKFPAKIIKADTISTI